MNWRNSSSRSAILCATVLFSSLAAVYQAGAQTLIDPSNLHVGAGYGTACQKGCAGDPNKIGSGGTLDVFQVSNGQSATVNAPTLLILSVPNDTVDNTLSYLGPTSSSVYTSLGVKFYDGGSPVVGSANVATAGLLSDFGGLKAPVSGGFFGSMTSGEVYTFLNFGKGGGIDSSNNFSNFTGQDPTATSFGVYVISLLGGAINPSGEVNVTGLNLPTGTFIDAIGEDSAGKPFVVPFTEAGVTTPGPAMTPEPASMLLFGTGLVALGGMLKRRKALS